VLPFVVVAVGLVAVCIVDLFQPISRRYVDRFLRRYPVHVTENNGPMLLRRLARVRAARTLGGLAGAVVAIAWGLHGNSGNVVFVAVGYLLGAVAAEVPARSDRAVGPRPAASLLPRRLREYVPQWLVCAPGVIVGVTVLIAVAGGIGARRADAEVQLGGRVGVAIAIAIAAMAFTVVLTLVTARAILYRSQPYTTAELVSADDALRAASLHCVCGGGLAITAIIGSVVVWDVGELSDVQALRWVAPWLGLALMFTAYFAWFAARVGPWLVRRPYYVPAVRPS
jgi:hypothetical protein